MSQEPEIKAVDLAGLWGAEAEGLKAKLAQLRAGFRHNGTSGSGAEEALRELLELKLPASIGVTQGQIFDSAGRVSKQSDVILYDADRTPLVLTSAQGGSSLVPVEGVIAVIEVKASFSAVDLPGVIANMSAVKSMKKTAYFLPGDGAVEGYNVYGAGSVHPWPITYSLFAYESSSFENLAPAFNAANGSLPVESRIDNACFLDKGAMLNLTPVGESVPLPSQGTLHHFGRSPHALLYWYLAASAVWFQAKHYPIKMLNYLTSPAEARVTPIDVV
ncbi:DUF6602 domain-containing protein [Arthrobacter sp. A5]|uniref:DUF6602 domain-containing protein n=1 Tax=Arthrobacter sp. A5 TaxID=576926 RepID=UPI003DAA3F83